VHWGGNAWEGHSHTSFFGTTPLAKDPVKIHLDAGDTKESNKHDKNIPLHLKFLRKIHVCAFPKWFFGNIQRESKNSFPASRLGFSIRFLRFADVWRTLEHPVLRKSWFGLICGKN